MKSLLSRSFGLGLAWLGLSVGLRATLVTPPVVDYVYCPGNCNVNQTITITVGAHAELSDNSDGNDWNTGMAVIARINIDYLAPGGSWTPLYEWLPEWISPAEVSVNLTPNAPGTWYFRVRVMDGRPWYTPSPSDYYVYSINVATPGPSITSSLSVNVNQGQNVSYQITATNNPTSFGASNLPAGLSLNTSTGYITGVLTASSSVTSTISATNSVGTDTKNLVWNITAAVLIPNASVSPQTILTGQSVTLTRNGSANFGIAWTENVIWQPSGQAQVLGNMGLGSMNYTPTAGPGTYWLQYRLVDTYFNYVDQWVSFVVKAPPVAQSVSATSAVVGSAIQITARATDADGNLTYIDFYVTGPGYSDTYIGSAAASNGYDATVTFNWTLPTAGSYTVRIGAHDADNNYYSGASVSNGFSIVVLTAPSNATATNVTSSSVTIQWQASTSTNGVARYEVYRNGAYVGQVAPPALTYVDNTVASSTSYTYAVKAVDTAGFYSAASNSVPVTTATAGTNSVQYTYDSSGRLVQVGYVGVSTEHYTYSVAGNLTQVSSTQP